MSRVSANTVPLSAVAAGLILSALDLHWITRIDAAMVDESGEALPAFAMGILVYGLGCYCGALITRTVLARIATSDERFRTSVSLTFSIVVFAAIIAHGLQGAEGLRLRNAPGVLASVALGAGVSLILFLLRTDLQQRFSQHFDRILRSLGLASLISPLWLVLRLDRHDSVGFALTDSLLVAAGGLVLTIVFFKIPLQSQARDRALVTVVVLALIAGTVSFLRHDPFMRLAPDADLHSGREIPRVVLISIDTLRRDALSCYSDDAPSTPNIDRLAEDSLVFENAYAAGPWTVPSLVSMHTGVPVAVHGINEFFLRVPDEYETLAEHMTGAGYRSGAVVSNSNLEPKHNLTQGFHDYAYVLEEDGNFRNEPIGRALFRKTFPARFDTSSTRVTNLVIDWISSNDSGDFFLWVHYFDPHFPFAPPPEFTTPRNIVNRLTVPYNWEQLNLSARERTLVKQLYHDEVRYIDHEVGRIIATLEALDLYHNTLIILTSDHGEEFWEHGDFYHAHSLYNELLQIPLLVKLPGERERGRNETRVSNQFLMGTILELCGIPATGERFDFPSLASLLGGSANGSSLPPIVAEGTLYVEQQRALIKADHKVIHRYASRRTELYNLLGNGASELDNIAESSPETRDELLESLETENDRLQQIRKASGITVGPSRELPRRSLDRLKALGYVQ